MYRAAFSTAVLLVTLLCGSAIADTIPVASVGGAVGLTSYPYYQTLTKVDQAASYSQTWYHPPEAPGLQGWNMQALGSVEVFDGSNPTITAQLGITGWDSLDAISYATLTYYFEVVPKDPGVVVLTVPITLATSGELNISLSGWGTIHANAWAKYYDEQSPFFWLSSSGPGDQAHAETYYRYAPPNQVRSITMYAGGGFYSNNRDTGQMTAVMDPRIQVDPLATFVWNGNNLLYSDYFSLEFSEGFAAAPPSPTIPEPASFALMTIGLAGTAVAAFRRRRDSK